MNKVLRKQAHVLVGLFLNLIILLSIFSCFTVTSFAADSAITEAEAKELLYEAYRIYMTYQDGSQKRFGGIGRLVTTTRDAVSSEAHRVYVDGIADSAWMYRCSSRKEDMQPTFSENQDGTVTFVSFLPMGYRKYTIRTKFEFTYIPSDQDPDHVFYWPEKPADIIIKDLESDGEKAEAKVWMSREYTDSTPCPIWVDVFFSNTASGWRISGGSFVYALTDWNNEDLKYEKAYAHFPNGLTIDSIVASVYLKKVVSVSEIVSPDPVLPVQYFDARKAVVRWEVLSIDEDGYELLIEFSEGDNPQGYYPQYLFEPSGKNRTYNAVFTRSNDGDFVLTGGGCYELAQGNENVSPYTGDRTGALIVITVASLLSLSACVIVRRKRQRIPR